MSKTTESVADKFRRYCLDNGLQVAVIPRVECVRIVNKVTIDPDVDITIYPIEGVDASNISTPQYHVIVKQDDKKELSFIQACEVLTDVVDSLSVR